MKQIERETIEQSDGTQGRPALVVVDGKVYDVSRSELWKGGIHFNTHTSGQDLSEAIKAAPHGSEVLERVECIGDFAEPSQAVTAEQFNVPPKSIAMLLAKHPHPMSVHFPIALSITAAFFTFLALIFGNQTMETVASYNLVLATLAAPASICTGLLSWYYNYGGIWTSIYRTKASLSGLLLALQLCALAIHFLGLHSSGAVGYWVYNIVVLALAPTVMAIGYFGGKITFPS